MPIKLKYPERRALLLKSAPSAVSPARGGIVLRNPDEQFAEQSNLRVLLRARRCGDRALWVVGCAWWTRGSISPAKCRTKMWHVIWSSLTLTS
ncbi:hypothetical protein PsYK624_131510 [Phanerochaete sordida]|uniref:Uncharacterized protein n=1 Tax=Phanerochaete sordida TaxID=48140 RepID=A0A9P3LK67_9APHY|nr:hypothetical protein PsYK624_131510 [Phanerochaete sordida]